MNEALANFRDGPASRHVEAIQQIKTTADARMAQMADTLMSETLLAVFKARWEAGRAELLAELKNKEAMHVR